MEYLYKNTSNWAIRHRTGINSTFFIQNYTGWSKKRGPAIFAMYNTYSVIPVGLLIISPALIQYLLFIPFYRGRFKIEGPKYLVVYLVILIKYLKVNESCSYDLLSMKALLIKIFHIWTYTGRSKMKRSKNFCSFTVHESTWTHGINKTSNTSP